MLLLGDLRDVLEGDPAPAFSEVTTVCDGGGRGDGGAASMDGTGALLPRCVAMMCCSTKYLVLW